MNKQVSNALLTLHHTISYTESQLSLLLTNFVILLQLFRKIIRLYLSKLTYKLKNKIDSGNH